MSVIIWFLVLIDWFSTKKTVQIFVSVSFAFGCHHCHCDNNNNETKKISSSSKSHQGKMANPDVQLIQFLLFVDFRLFLDKFDKLFVRFDFISSSSSLSVVDQKKNTKRSTDISVATVICCCCFLSR